MGFLSTPAPLARRLSDDEQIIQVGAGAFNDGFYEVAEKQFSLFLRDYPNHEKAQEVSYLLGRSYFLAGKLKEAKAVFSKIIPAAKNFEQMDFALFWGAETEIRLSNGESARTLLLHLTRRFPKFEWIDHAHYLLGLLDLSLNALPEAQSSLKRVSQLSRNKELIQPSLFWLGILAYRQGDYRAAEGYFKAVLEDPPALSQDLARQALFWLGETHVKLEKFNEARSSYRTYLDRFKSDGIAPEVSWRLAFCEYRLGKLKESIEIFQQFKNQFRNSKLIPFTHYLLGKIFLEKGDFSSSIKELTAVLGGSPNALWGASLLSLYWSYVHLGEMEEANKVFQRLLKMTSYEEEKLHAQRLGAELAFSEGRISDALPYYFNILNSGFRERALFQIGKGYFFEKKFRDALTNLDILFLEFPNSKYFEEGLFIKGEGLVALGTTDRALETYNLLLRRKKNDLWHLLGCLEMAALHLARNEEDQAEKVFKDVVEKFQAHPLSSQALYQLGNISFKRKNMTDAIQNYSLILKEKAPSVLGEACFRLGEVFYLTGKYDNAFSSFENAIRHLPERSPWFFLTQLEMGNLQRRWGRSEEARKAYQIVIERSNDEVLARAAKELLSQLDER